MALATIPLLAADGLNSDQNTKVAAGSGMQAALVVSNDVPYYFMRLSGAATGGQFRIAATFDYIARSFDANFNVTALGYKLAMADWGDATIANLVIYDASISTMSNVVVAGTGPSGGDKVGSMLGFTLLNGMTMKNYVAVPQLYIIRSGATYSPSQIADEVLLTDYDDKSMIVSVPSATQNNAYLIKMTLYRLL